MPHPRNRMKLTGDIHPPEVEYDLSTSLDTDDDALPAEAPRLDDADLRMDAPAEPSFVVLAVPATVRARGKAQQLAGRQLETRPVAAILGAFAIGALLARIL